MKTAGWRRLSLSTSLRSVRVTRRTQNSTPRGLAQWEPFASSSRFPNWRVGSPTAVAGDGPPFVPAQVRGCHGSAEGDTVPVPYERPSPRVSRPWVLPTDNRSPMGACRLRRSGVHLRRGAVALMRARGRLAGVRRVADTTPTSRTRPARAARRQAFRGGRAGSTFCLCLSPGRGGPLAPGRSTFRPFHPST
jgi:hypothetical protein